jgi:hypothetical protein
LIARSWNRNGAGCQVEPKADQRPEGGVPVYYTALASEYFGNGAELAQQCQNNADCSRGGTLCILLYSGLPHFDAVLRRLGVNRHALHLRHHRANLRLDVLCNAVRFLHADVAGQPAV